MPLRAVTCSATSEPTSSPSVIRLARVLCLRRYHVAPCAPVPVHASLFIQRSVAQRRLTARCCSPFLPGTDVELVAVAEDSGRSGSWGAFFRRFIADKHDSR